MEEKDLTFADFFRGFDAIGKGEWITAYASRGDPPEGPVFYSALIREERVPSSLENPSWDLSIGNGFPGFSFHFEDGKEVATYFRCSDEGIEPLVILRSFFGIRKSYWEVAEEFRFYFNLYEDQPNKKFLFINDNGDEEDAVLMSDNEIKIKGRLIKEFLAAKNMRLALFFDINRFSEKPLKELSINEYHDERKGHNFVISIGARPSSFGSRSQSHGFLIGKKLIAGLPNFTPNILNRKDKTFIDFIIGLDEHGADISYTCDESRLGNYFGKNPDSPQYVTPVFFKKEVLSKYYAQPGKYSVEDGSVSCGGLWSLRMDNNDPKSVMVLLGDLGHLSHTEQSYWRTFSVASGKMSRTAFARSFEGEFADPENPELLFKQKFGVFQGKWEEKFGWKFFKPMTEGDAYYIKTLRVPLTNEQREFDEQVLTLAKILIDSLNEKELSKGLTLAKENPKGLDKLEAFLAARDIKFTQMEFLRKLQELRSAATAHRKGKRYEDVKEFFGIGQKDFPLVFEDILKKCIWTLNSLETHLLK